MNIFGPKRDEVIGIWRKLHEEELHDEYSSPNMIDLIKKYGMGRAHSMHEYEGRCIQDSGGET
jgi:hypothetical protein